MLSNKRRKKKMVNRDSIGLFELSSAACVLPCVLAQSIGEIRQQKPIKCNLTLSAKGKSSLDQKMFLFVFNLNAFCCK